MNLIEEKIKKDFYIPEKIMFIKFTDCYGIKPYTPNNVEKYNNYEIKIYDNIPVSGFTRLNNYEISSIFYFDPRGIIISKDFFDPITDIITNPSYIVNLLVGDIIYICSLSTEKPVPVIVGSKEYQIAKEVTDKIKTVSPKTELKPGDIFIDGKGKRNLYLGSFYSVYVDGLEGKVSKNKNHFYIKLYDTSDLKNPKDVHFLEKASKLNFKHTEGRNEEIKDYEKFINEFLEENYIWQNDDCKIIRVSSEKFKEKTYTPKRDYVDLTPQETFDFLKKRGFSIKIFADIKNNNLFSRMICDTRSVYNRIRNLLENEQYTQSITLQRYDEKIFEENGEVRVTFDLNRYENEMLSYFKFYQLEFDIDGTKVIHYK